MENIKRRKFKRLRNIILLLLLTTSVTIGYSIVSTSLNITGTSSIKRAIWDVHFENIKVTKNSNVEAIKKPSFSEKDKQTDIFYEVNLYKPGDVYEFTVDVVNKGGIDARLSKEPLLDGVSIEQDTYVNYTFSHLDGSKVKKDEIILTGNKEKYIVRVEFDKTITKQQLPKEKQDLNLRVRMDWEQA